MAASIAHNDMLGSGGDFACHEISHYITEEYGVPHGGALALIIPAWCEYTAGYDMNRMTGFLKDVFEIEAFPGSEGDLVKTGVTKLKEYIKSVGIEVELSRAAHYYDGSQIGDTADFDKMAEDILQGRESLGFGFMPLYKENIKDLMKKIV